MKVLFLTLVFTVTLLFSARCEAASSANGLRQDLVNRPDIESVYVVDSTHTFVKGPILSPDGRAPFRVVGRYFSGPDNTHVATMIEHGEEPFVYKSSASSLEDLKPLRSGKAILTAQALDSGQSGYSALDIFETATLSCQRRGGHPIYVVPRKYGGFKRLTEVSAREAFEYILERHRSGTWLAVCDGASDVRFQVLKNYDFVNDGVEMAELREGLVLEDVNYVKDERAEATRLAVLENSWPKTSKSLEATAREIAAIKVGYVRKFDGKRHYGAYKGAVDKGRCASVSIKSVEDGEDAMLSEVHDYKVCSGKVYAQGSGGIIKKTIEYRDRYLRGGGLKVASGQ